MKIDIKSLLRRVLPLKAREVVRMYWWLLTYYSSTLVTSWFVERKAEVHAYGSDPSLAGLVNQISDTNVLSPTRMCRVMTKYGSDKGRGWHNFTTLYSVLFKEFEDRSIRLFELGLSIPGRPGASLRGWRDLFPNASVYGADIDRTVLFQDNRIETFYCDQLDKASIHQLWSEPHLQNGVDIIIEDGLHTFEGNISFLENSIEHLRPGGIYVIEDIEHSTVTRWKAQLETIYPQRYPKYAFALVLLPNASNAIDNNILVVRRSPE